MYPYYLIIILICNITYNSCTESRQLWSTGLKLERRDIPPQAPPQNDKGPEDTEKLKVYIDPNKAVPGVRLQDQKLAEDPAPQLFNNQVNTPKQNVSTVKTSTSTKAPVHEIKSVTDVESGALLRGLLVFVILSVLFLVYLGLKSYFRHKPIPIVTKYGVRTLRSDIEMTPLPLDDDEEDETVFELGNQNR